MATAYEDLATLFEWHVQENARLKQSLDSSITENAQLKLRLSRSETNRDKQGRASDDLLKSNKKLKAEAGKLRQQVEDTARSRNIESTARKRFEKELTQLKTELESTRNALQGAREAAGLQSALGDSSTATQDGKLSQANIPQDFILVLIDGGKFPQSPQSSCQQQILDLDHLAFHYAPLAAP